MWSFWSVIREFHAQSMAAGRFGATGQLAQLPVVSVPQKDFVSANTQPLCTAGYRVRARSLKSLSATRECHAPFTAIGHHGHRGTCAQLFVESGRREDFELVTTHPLHMAEVYV